MRTVHERRELQEASLRGHVVAGSQVDTYWPWALVGCAWMLIVVGTLTSHNEWINHDYLLERSGLPWLVALVVFLICWQVMTAGMMAPSVLLVLRKDAHARWEWSRSAEAVFLLGYFLVWTGFAGAAFMGDTVVHALVDHWTWLGAHSSIIGATTLAAAGIFQCSPWKRLCLAACRHPVRSSGQESPISSGAPWRLGLRHGLACLGSGWALMLVLFGLGGGGLGGMLVFTSLMVVEKAAPGGRRLASVVGIVLLALAMAWWVHPGWLPRVDA